MKRTFVVVAVTLGCGLMTLVSAPPAQAQCLPAAAAPPCCAISGLAFPPPAPPGDFVWAPAAVACPVFYDVAQGDLATAWSAKSVVGGPLTFCMVGEDGAAGLVAMDAAVPPVGQGFWYLVRADVVGGDETWNEVSPALVVDRDPPLIAICPF